MRWMAFWVALACAAAVHAADPIVDSIVVRVDGRTWTTGDLDALARSRRVTLSTTNAVAFVEQMIAFELTVIEARKAGVDGSETCRQRIARGRSELLAYALYAEKPGTPAAQIEAVAKAKVGERTPGRDEVQAELDALPEPHRKRFSTKEGLAEFTRRVAQKQMFAAYVEAHRPDLIRRMAPRIAEVEKMEATRAFFEKERLRDKSAFDARVAAWKQEHRIEFDRAAWLDHVGSR